METLIDLTCVYFCTRTRRKWICGKQHGGQHNIAAAQIIGKYDEKMNIKSDEKCNILIGTIFDVAEKQEIPEIKEEPAGIF